MEPVVKHGYISPFCMSPFTICSMASILIHNGLTLHLRGKASSQFYLSLYYLVFGDNALIRGQEIGS